MKLFWTGILLIFLQACQIGAEPTPQDITGVWFYVEQSRPDLYKDTGGLVPGLFLNISKKSGSRIRALYQNGGDIFCMGEMTIQYHERQIRLIGMEKKIRITLRSIDQELFIKEFSGPKELYLKTGWRFRRSRQLQKRFPETGIEYDEICKPPAPKKPPLPRGWPFDIQL